MSGLRFVLAAGLFVSACTTTGPASPAPAAQSHSSAPASTPPSSIVPVDSEALPPADRVFFTGGLVLGADAGALWARAPGAKGAQLFRVDGPGVVHAVVHGDLGDGPRLFVARGVGRGRLDAPLVLQSLDPATGEGTELWRHAGERNEPVTLAFGDVDRDGVSELAFSYFSSKYMVRTRHLKAHAVAMPEGPEVRMATAQAFGDLTGDGKADLVLGRVYGDAKDLPGDLRVDRGQGLEAVAVDRGVKSVLLTQTRVDAGPALYFCDGWVANYGKEARAALKRLSYKDGKAVVDTLGGSADEFTFFALTAADVDGDGKPEIVAQGDKRLTVFYATDSGPFRAEAKGAFEPLLNTAIGVDERGLPVAYIPGRPQSRVLPLR